jgi:predicted alpha-1,2-mannosidase
LDRVQVEGGAPDQRTIFYTGLYHMLLSPNVFSDGNGDYIGFDGKVRRLPEGEVQYANFSDWDTYRSVVHFHSLLLPRETSQMMQSLVRDAEQSGWLPRWPVANDVSYVMGGDSSAILLASSYAFGVRNFDAKTALQFMVKGATQPGTGPHGQSLRPGLAEYLSREYLPSGKHQESGASITLEYASADFAISRLADALGDSANAARLLRSSQNWRSLFDPEAGFIHPRTADGKFLAGFDPDQLLPHHVNWDKSNQLGFEEGSAWQYTWMIPHNYAGLFQAMGGNEKVIPKLDKFFQKLSGWGIPNFTVTNEPDFCAPYAYVWTANAWKTQQVIDRIRRETFTTQPDGLPGNDDLGATSGVYVWNALGMYPVIPGVGGVVLGTPMFPRVTWKLGDGRTLEIISQGEGIYVHAVSLNGAPRSSAWLPLDALSAKQNRLEFMLQKEPDHNWASRQDDLPPSFDVPKN